MLGVYSGLVEGLLNKDDVLAALKRVKDPELRLDVVTLNMIKNLEVNDGRVSFILELTTPACPHNVDIERDVRNALKSIPGVKSFDFKVTARVWVGKPKVEDDMLPGVKNVIAVASGKGGVGKSTVAANIALALAEMGSKVGLMDADIYGPTLAKVLKMQQKPTVSSYLRGRITPAETYLGVKVVSIGLFLVDDSPMMWRGPMISSTIKQLLTEVDWGDLDYLIVDLPPGTGDASLTVAQSTPLTGVVIVSTPQEVAYATAIKALKMFRRLDIPIIGIIENMSKTVCPHCGNKLEFFGSGGVKKASGEIGTYYLGEIPLNEDIRIFSDEGKSLIITNPKSPVANCFRQIAKQIAGRISVIAHKRLTGKPTAMA